MSGVDRSFSFNNNDERSLQPGYRDQQSSYQPQNVSPIEEHSAYIEPGPPPPQVHRHHPTNTAGSSFAQHQSQSQRQYGIQPAPRRESLVTPGMDNLGERAAGGGVTGLAMGIAGANERESGVQALRDIDGWGRTGNNRFSGRSANTPPERRFNDADPPYASRNVPDSPGRRPVMAQQSSQASYGSAAPLAGGAYAMGSRTPGSRTPTNYSERSLPLHPNSSVERFANPPYGAPGPYNRDNPYSRYSASQLQFAAGASIDPNLIEDDGDDGMGPPEGHVAKRRSVLSPFGAHRNSTHSSLSGPTAVGAGIGAGAAAGAGLGTMNRDGSGSYAPVAGGNNSGNSGNFINERTAYVDEKSAWLEKQGHGKKRLRWLMGLGIGVIIIGAIVGGILGGVVFKNRGGNNTNGDNASQGQSAADDTKQNGDIDKNSAEIKALLNNKNLKKVFPGMDYTPLNAQYPACIHNPPSQNNVTRDIAVISQLTDHVRLYGTDCNQTQMVLHALDRLDLPNTKLWLGIHQDTNATTNARQIQQAFDILDDRSFDESRFKGIIVGNEVLFRKEMTIANLSEVLTTVRGHMDDQGIHLPLATADLGDAWTAELTEVVDVVMANIHPFFAGVTADVGAGWTWDFWTTKDVVLTANNATKKHVVSEVGWPSGGGNSCGQSTCTSSTQGSVAGIDEMNTFMEDYVCQSLRNETVFFWFEAFDEPWKIQFNEPGKEWEDKWGLFDVNRNLKDGVVIPDCGGASMAYVDA